MRLKRAHLTAARVTLSEAPPSVNAMYTPIGKGRNILTREGRAWKKLAESEFFDQVGICPEPSYWRLDVLIPGRGVNSNDLPNFEKALTDALVEADLAPDDRYLVDYRFRFYGGEIVVIALKTEELEKWVNIKKPSKSLMRKLAKSSPYQARLL